MHDENKEVEPVKEQEVYVVEGTVTEPGAAARYKATIEMVVTRAKKEKEQDNG